MEGLFITMVFAICFKYAIDKLVFKNNPVFTLNSGKVVSAEEVVELYNAILNENKKLRKERK